MQPVLTLIVAHICSMLGFATFAALLPQLRDEWSLTNAQAGLVGGMFFGGYVVSVSYWTALTDRSDGRKVYAAASVFAALLPANSYDLHSEWGRANNDALDRFGVSGSVQLPWHFSFGTLLATSLSVRGTKGPKGSSDDRRTLWHR